MRKVVFILMWLGIVSLCSSPSYAFWIWSPKTGSWKSPKQSVKPTPKGQLKVIQELYDGKKYQEALEESQKLIKHYPKAYEASEAQLFIGLSLEGMQKFYEGYKAYQKVIDKYPFSSRIDEIIERQLKIGQTFMSGEKRKAAGIDLPVENPSIEIFRKVVENSPYGKHAAQAQYLLGMILKNVSRFQEAHDEFEKVVTTYPESEWASPAKFQVADCASKIAPKAEYDQELTQEAKKKFEEFVKSQPDAALQEEARSQIDSLKEKEAQGNLHTAGFYEKQKKYDAARIYYQEIVNNCSYCESASIAREKLKELEKK